MNYALGGKAEFDSPTKAWAGDRFGPVDTTHGWGVVDRATGNYLRDPGGENYLQFLILHLPDPPGVSGEECDLDINGERLAQAVAMYAAAQLNEIWDQQRANILAEAEAGVIEAARVVADSMWAGHGVTPTQAKDLYFRLQTYDALRGVADQ